MDVYRKVHHLFSDYASSSATHADTTDGGARSKDSLAMDWQGSFGKGRDGFGSRIEHLEDLFLSFDGFR